MRDEMARERERDDPIADPTVRFATLAILDDELDQSGPELAQELEHRVDYPDLYQYDGDPIARIPDGWIIGWRDVAPQVLERLECEDPPLVERLVRPDPETERFRGRPWPAAARRFRLTDAGERELARLRGEDAGWDEEDEED